MIFVLRNLCMRFKELFLIDLRSLAIFRIGIALCVITDLFNSFRYIDFFQTSNGFLPIKNSLGIFASLPHYWNNFYVFQVFLWIIAFIFAIMLLIGCYTRLATFVLWGMLVSLHLLLGVSIDGADNFLRAVLLWSIFLPFGAYW